MVNFVLVFPATSDTTQNEIVKGESSRRRFSIDDGCSKPVTPYVDGSSENDDSYTDHTSSSSDSEETDDDVSEGEKEEKTVDDDVEEETREEFRNDRAAKVSSM